MIPIIFIYSNDIIRIIQVVFIKSSINTLKQQSLLQLLIKYKQYRLRDLFKASELRFFKYQKIIEDFVKIKYKHLSYGLAIYNIVNSSIDNIPSDIKIRNSIVKMIEIQKNLKSDFLKNIMVFEMLTTTFKKSTWKQISTNQPNIFLLQQTSILNILINDEELFNQHFMKFYNNHFSLYKWFVLASEKHSQIKKYIFSDLLKKNVKDFRIEMKLNTLKKMKNKDKLSEKSLQVSKFCMRSAPESPKKVSLPQQQQRISQSQYKQKDSLQNKISIRQSNSSHHQDYHELFMKTLQACDGSKYIYYDFSKHQKGYQSKSSYNKYIRCRNNIKANNKNLSNMENNYSTLKFRKNYQNKENQIKNQTTPFFYFQRNSAHCTPGSGVNSPYSRDQNDKENNQKIGHRKHIYSNFEMMPFGSLEKKQKWVKNYRKQQLVLKKMPHIFGKRKHFQQKASLAQKKQ